MLFIDTEQNEEKDDDDIVTAQGGRV